MSLRAIFIGTSGVALILALASCGGHEESIGIFTDAKRAGENLSDTSDLYVAAHPDDDLLFMNPDVAASIAANRGVVVLFLTAGDGGKDASYWEQREEGIRDAYAWMASVPNRWLRAHLVVAGKAVWMDTLEADNRVHLVFFRLPDGHIRGGGSSRYASTSLMRLWNHQIEVIQSVDGLTHYTPDELVDTLIALMLREGVSFVGTLNDQQATEPPPGIRRDHSDHAYSSLFARAAALRLPNAVEIRRYRGYDTRDEAPNLDVAEIVAKHATFARYALHDTAICPTPVSCRPNSLYQIWLQRQYVVQAP